MTRTRRSVRVRRAVCVSLFAAAGTALAAFPASAKQQQINFTCNGQPVTVRANTNHSSPHGGWGSAKVVSGGSAFGSPSVGSPVEFKGKVTDTTLMPHQVVFAFDAKKGHGKAEHNQQTITCIADPQSGTVGDFVPSGVPLPPGASRSDDATFVLTVFVVTKGHKGHKQGGGITGHKVG